MVNYSWTLARESLTGRRHPVPCYTLKSRSRYRFRSDQKTICAQLSRGASRTKVVDHLLLLRTKPETQPGEAEQSLDNLWSLQYRVLGPICAFAGALSPQSKIAQGFTHALHLRFGQPHLVQHFRSNPLTVQTIQQELDRTCESLVEVTFQSEVQSELETVFRRGPEWDQGVEQLFMLEPREGADEANLLDFVSQLSELAEHPQIGGLQACYGSTWEADKKVATLIRFRMEEELRAFLATPPCRALLASDDRVPGTPLLSLAFKIAPATDTNVRAAEGAGSDVRRL